LPNESNSPGHEHPEHFLLGNARCALGNQNIDGSVDVGKLLTVVQTDAHWAVRLFRTESGARRGDIPRASIKSLHNKPITKTQHGRAITVPAVQMDDDAARDCFLLQDVPHFRIGKQPRSGKHSGKETYREP
jgi:hypothetical protein